MSRLPPGPNSRKARVCRRRVEFPELLLFPFVEGMVVALRALDLQAENILTSSPLLERRFHPASITKKFAAPLKSALPGVVLPSP